MAANFTELVLQVERRNEENRQKMLSAISPFLDIAMQKGIYNKEKAALSKGYQDIAAQEGWSFQTPMVNGQVQSPEVMGAAFQSQRGINQEETFGRQWFESNSVPLPEGWDSMNPQQRKVVLQKNQEVRAQTLDITATLDAYPELKSRLPQNFTDMPEASQRKVLNRKLVEFERQQAMALQRSGGGGGGAGGGNTILTPSEDRARQTAVDNARSRIVQYENGFRIGQIGVKVHKGTIRGIGRNMNIASTTGRDPLYYDGKNFYDSRGRIKRKPDSEKAASLTSAWGLYKSAEETLQSAQERRYDDSVQRELNAYGFYAE